MPLVMLSLRGGQVLQEEISLLLYVSFISRVFILLYPWLVYVKGFGVCPKVVKIPLETMAFSSAFMIQYKIWELLWKKIFWRMS